VSFNRKILVGLALGVVAGLSPSASWPSGLDELRRRAEAVAGADERPRHHEVDVGLRGQGPQVGRFAAEAGGHGARAHDERSASRQ
jgi:hypothetical protein